VAHTSASVGSIDFRTHNQTGRLWTGGHTSRTYTCVSRLRAMTGRLVYILVSCWQGRSLHDSEIHKFGTVGSTSFQDDTGGEIDDQRIHICRTDTCWWRLVGMTLVLAGKLVLVFF